MQQCSYIQTRCLPVLEPRALDLRRSGSMALLTLIGPIWDQTRPTAWHEQLLKLRRVLEQLIGDSWRRRVVDHLSQVADFECPGTPT